MSLRNRLTQSLTQFGRDERGSLAVPFALCSVLLVGGVGVAMDMGRVVNQKEKVQGVADAASLAAARSGEKGNGQLRKIADAVFIEHFGKGGDKLITSVKRDGDAVRVVAEDQVQTTLSKLLGFKVLDLSVESTSLYAERRMDIALVLDTTESMRGANMEALKRSAGNFIDIIDDADVDTVKVGIAPYAQHVNVGLSYRDAEWLDVPADEQRATTRRVEGSERNCRRVSGTGSRDGVPTTYDYTKCDYDTEPGPDRTATWQGCVGSRNIPLDANPAYSGVKIPGLLDKPCGAELLTPTTNMTKVRQTLNGLNPQGDTYMPAGLMWGWRMLEPSAPLPNADPAPDGDRVVVLMTDGLNTRSKSGDSHWGRNQIETDQKTANICTSMKGTGVTVYTIGYGINDGATRNLLRNCASGANTYFDARDAAQLERAFEDIAASIKELRVSA